MYEVIVRGPSAEAVTAAIKLLGGAKRCSKEVKALIKDQKPLSVEVEHGEVYAEAAKDTAYVAEQVAIAEGTPQPAPALQPDADLVGLLQEYVQKGGEQGVANALKLLGEFGARRISEVKGEDVDRVAERLREALEA